MIPCNILHDHAGIDWSNPDPDHDFTIEQRECGKPALYANRHTAGEPESFACASCYYALGSEGQIDWWPLKAEHLPPADDAGGDRSTTRDAHGGTLMLRVWKNGTIDWVIAADPEHAANLWCLHTGYSRKEYEDEFGPPGDEWELVPDSEEIEIRDYYDPTTKEEATVTKTAAGWVAHEGKPGFLCSTEY